MGLAQGKRPSAYVSQRLLREGVTLPTLLSRINQDPILRALTDELRGYVLPLQESNLVHRP